MDLKQSLDALKPALVGGYNKDAVYNLMEQLLTECREESLKEISELKAENSRLEAENRGYKDPRSETSLPCHKTRLLPFPNRC